VADLIGRGDDVPFRLRLAQAIAWCARLGDLANPAASLRHDRLRPPLLETARESTVNLVVASRRSWLPDDVTPVARAADLNGGRLLVYWPDDSLSDGAAEGETRGFFDVDNAPPWDTWVGLFRDQDADRYSDYLASWVPPEFVELVDRGIDVNPEDCIRWLDDTDVAVARHLREHGIVAGR
jgi:hypothetical protein